VSTGRQVRFTPQQPMWERASKIDPDAKTCCERMQQECPERRLFNHLVGAGEQRGGNTEPERLGGFEVAVSRSRSLPAFRT
jgi:hypothetical protein